MTRRTCIASLGALAANSLRAGDWDKAESLLSTAAAEKKPLASVLCIQQGKSRHVRAFGECKEDSRFLIASISKPMTASGVLWLADRGKLKLDDPVSRYIPEFAAGDRSAMLIRHLLTHTCGLPDMLPANTELRKRNAPLEEYVRLSLTTPLLFSPGARWSYSSTGILIASEVARRIDGRPIAQLLAEEIYKPLGMSRTVLGLGSLQRSEVIRSQTEFAPGDLGGAQGAADWDWNSKYWRSLGAPWGGAHASAADIATFLGSFLHPSGKPLSKNTAQLMITNQCPSGIRPHGLGWSLGSRLSTGLSESAFGHGGSTGTLCWADPTSDRSFVLLTSLPDAVARKAIIQPVSQLVASSRL